MSFTLDTREFSAAARDLKRVVRKDSATIVRQQTRLGVRDAVKMTPPFRTGGQNEPFNVQRRAGENAVREDISRVFQPIDSLDVYRNPGSEVGVALRRAVRRRDTKAVEALLRRIGITLIAGVLVDVRPEMHVRARSRRGRVSPRRRPYIVLRSAGVRRYVREQVQKVGNAKGRWPILQSGNKAPRWIMRHGRRGLWDDDSKHPTKPSITFGNTAFYIQATGMELRIMQRVIANRIHNMKAVTERTLKRRAAKASAR